MSPKPVYAELRDIFTIGLLIFIPFVVTITILRVGFTFLDNLLRPYFHPIIGDITGLGLISIGLTILFFGLIGRYSKWTIEKFERTLLRIPIVGGIYFTVKQTIEMFFIRKDTLKERVVLVEFPRTGIYSIGFTTGAVVSSARKETKKDLLNVYVPTSPNPTTGFFLMVPRNKVKPLRMGVDEAFGLILSGGLGAVSNSKAKRR